MPTSGLVLGIAVLGVLLGAATIVRAFRCVGKKRRRFLVFGALLSIVSVPVLVLFTVLFVSSIDWYRFSRTKSLIPVLNRGDWDSQRARRVVYQRLRAGKIDADDMRPLAHWALDSRDIPVLAHLDVRGALSEAQRLSYYEGLVDVSATAGAPHQEDHAVPVEIDLTANGVWWSAPIVCEAEVRLVPSESLSESSPRAWKTAQLRWGEGHQGRVSDKSMAAEVWRGAAVLLRGPRAACLEGLVSPVGIGEDAIRLEVSLKFYAYSKSGIDRSRSLWQASRIVTTAPARVESVALRKVDLVTHAEMAPTILRADPSPEVNLKWAIRCDGAHYYSTGGKLAGRITISDAPVGCAFDATFVSANARIALGQIWQPQGATLTWYFAMPVKLPPRAGTLILVPNGELAHRKLGPVRIWGKTVKIPVWVNQW